MKSSIYEQIFIFEGNYRSIDQFSKMNNCKLGLGEGEASFGMFEYIK